MYTVGMNIGKAIFCKCGVRIGTKIVTALFIICELPQGKGNILEGDIRNGTGLLCVHQNAVFTFTADVVKEYALNVSYFGIFLALKDGDGDGLCRAPKNIGVTQFGLDHQIVEDHVFNRTLIPQLQGDGTVRVADHAVFNQNIAEKSLAFTAELDGGAGRGEGAVGHGDIFARAILHGSGGVFKYNAIVSAFDMAVGDPHVLAVVRIDAVAIGHAHGIQNADPVDQNIFTAYHMYCPESALFQCDVPDGQMCYIFQKQHGRTGVEDAFDMPGGYLAVEDLFVSIDATEAGDGQVFTIFGI